MVYSKETHIVKSTHGSPNTAGFLSCTTDILDTSAVQTWALHLKMLKGTTSAFYSADANKRSPDTHKD